MAYSVLYSSQSEKYLTRLTPSKSKRILTRIENLSKNPFETDNNVVRLSGTDTSFGLRIGDIGIIYFIDLENKSIYVTKIAPRGSAYSS